MDSVPEQSCRSSPCSFRSILHTPSRVETTGERRSSGGDFQCFIASLKITVFFAVLVVHETIPLYSRWKCLDRWLIRQHNGRLRNLHHTYTYRMIAVLYNPYLD